MPDQLYMPAASALVDPARIVPALPPGIPILPAGAGRRVPPVLIVLLVVLGLAGLTGLQIWKSHNRSESVAAKQIAAPSESGTKRIATHSGALSRRSAADRAKISRTVTLALITHRPKGTTIPVTLSNGVRLFQIESSTVRYDRAKQPTTCVLFGVTDPKNGARDAPETVCMAGLDYRIQ